MVFRRRDRIVVGRHLQSPKNGGTIDDMRSAMKRVSLAALLIMGCGSGKSADFSPFQGIYQVDSHTLNPSACESEGSPVAGSPPLLVIFTRVFGATALSCDDATNCREIGTMQGPILISPNDLWAHFVQVTPDGLWGSEITTCCPSTSGQSQCQEARGRDNRLVKDGSKIRLEIRAMVPSKAVSQFADCSSQPTDRALAGTCAALEVVNASFYQAL
jgi:hypothetical protein